MFAQALLDVYGCVQAPANPLPSDGSLPTVQASAHPSPSEGPSPTAQADSSKPEDESELAMRSPEDDMLVDTGFYAQSSISKETKAAAYEVLVRVLETGPSSLEPVKEAVGALRALAPGAVYQSTACSNTPCFMCI